MLLDTWYATKALLRCIDRWGQGSSGPLQENRHVDDAGDTRPSPRVDRLEWPADARVHGKTVTSKDCPKAYTMQRFRGVRSPQRPDDVVTNAGAHDDPSATRQGCGWRWQMEPCHRATKPRTGLEGCPCRTARSVRHHSGCAIRVWVRLQQVAPETRRTIYHVKPDVLSDYLRQPLRSPTVNMVLA